MRGIRTALLCGMIAGAPVALALDHVWIVGGGPSPADSQAQIEFNVNWIIQVLNGHPGARQTHVYYTDGTGAGRDVVQRQGPDEPADSLQPLARVFSDHGTGAERYYSHRVPRVLGGTEAQPLRASLEKEFAELGAGDRALLIYNGHGSRDSDDPADNAVLLWNETRLTVRDFDGMLQRIDPAVPVRFIFTQCYSGGFARLIRPQAQDSPALGEANRCGFFAESEDRESEGCSASIDAGDYRDYSTYFFAALHGRTRTGEAIGTNPDRNGDNIVSLYEAHLFALSQGHNADLPRATSEVFLERWQPWYLRWIDTGAEPDNVYGRLAREVARRNSLPESGAELIREMKTRRADMAQRMAGHQNEWRLLGYEIDSLQREIRKDVALRWPEALTPYSSNFVQFLKKDLNAAQDYIQANPRYAELVSRQDRRETLEVGDIASLERDITQLDKIRRLRLLARLLHQFERHATEQERAWYRRLQSCENQPL